MTYTEPSQRTDTELIESESADPAQQAFTEGACDAVMMTPYRYPSTHHYYGAYVKGYRWSVKNPAKAETNT